MALADLSKPPGRAPREMANQPELPPRGERRGLQPLRLGPPAGWSISQYVAVSLIGLTALVLLGSPQGGASTADALAYLILIASIGFGQEAARWLPGRLSRFGLIVATAAAVMAVMVAIDSLFGIGLDFLFVTLACLASCGGLVLSALLGWISSGRVRVARVAVIGSPSGKDSLARELEVAGIQRFQVVGWVPDAVGDADDGHDYGNCQLGTLADLGAIVTRHRVDLLVMTGEASRLTVFNEIARSCLDLPVRFCELANFHEDLFGHVPVTEINTAWFQYILHPRYNGATPVAKRVMDIATAAILGVLAAPVLVVAGLLIRREGGPAFFKQVRIGEGGEPFVLYKLRTMSAAPTVPVAQWAGEHDPRITKVGRLLRRTHIDELPQLINIARGEMSMVGPRPEQPEFVERLESQVPFYQRRHLIKPGLTGWAQVRCGYAGSERGSLWKASHDLYYLKHRSLGMDLAIIWETAVEILRPRPHTVTDAMVGWVFEAEPDGQAARRPAVASGPPVVLNPERGGRRAVS